MKKKVIIGLVVVGLVALAGFGLRTKLGIKKVEDHNKGDYIEEGDALVEKKEKLKTEKVFILEEEGQIKKTENQKFCSFQDRIISWNEGDLILFPGQEDERHVSLNIENPILATDENYVYVVNKDGGIIYFITKEGEMKERIELSRDLLNLKVIGENLVYHSKLAETESVGIFSKSGQNIMRYDYDFEKILDYDYDETDEKLIISVLQEYDGRIGSRLDIYNKKGEKKEIAFKDEIIVNIDILKIGNTLLLTDSKLYYFVDQQIVWEVEIDILKDYKVIGKDIYLLSGSSLKRIDTKGEIKEKYSFEGDYTNFELIKDKLSKGNILLYNKDMIGIFKGEEEILREDRHISEVFILDEKIYISDREKLGAYKIGTMEVEVEDE